MLLKALALKGLSLVNFGTIKMLELIHVLYAPKGYLCKIFFFNNALGLIISMKIPQDMQHFGIMWLMQSSLRMTI